MTSRELDLVFRRNMNMEGGIQRHSSWSAGESRRPTSVWMTCTYSGESPASFQPVHTSLGPAVASPGVGEGKHGSVVFFSGG